MARKIAMSLFERLLPTVAQHCNIFIKMKLVPLSDVIKTIFLTVLVVVSEAGGLALLLPILSFIKNDQDPIKFANDTSFGQYVFDTYEFIGVPLNFITLSLVVIFMITLRQFLNYLLTLHIDAVKLRVARDLALKAFSSIFDSSSSNVMKYKTGQFSAILTQESQASGALLRVYSRLASLTLTFVVYFSAMIFMSPIASVGSILLIAAIVFLMGRFGKITKRLADRRIVTRSNLLNFLNERFKAWKLIKLADTLSSERENAFAYMQRDIDTEFKVGKVAALIQLIMAPVVVFFALILAYIAIESFGVDIDTVAAFILILLRLIPVGQGFNGARHSLVSFTPSIVLLNKVINESDDSPEGQGNRKSIKPLETGLQFENVSFSYPGDPQIILANASFSIPAGSITAVIGPSGVGKTTLIDIITRILVPDQGRVLYDGIPIDEFDKNIYRKQLACMLQDMILFDGSVSDSIRYFNQSASDSQVREAAKLAYADEFINNFQEDYKTNIGEGGSRLSGGEKQRIALARLFLSKAKLVILDEPTSSLDSASEAKVLKAIKTLAMDEGRTVIVIAHRASTIEASNQVIKLAGNGVVSMSVATENVNDDLSVFINQPE